MGGDGRPREPIPRSPCSLAFLDPRQLHILVAILKEGNLPPGDIPPYLSSESRTTTDCRQIQLLVRQRLRGHGRTVAGHRSESREVLASDRVRQGNIVEGLDILRSVGKRPMQELH